ncbi:MAG TPA: hypothetical protein VFJ86_15710 [Usitatibacter sp.]|nr:hypothetical protein [Usitatibacter sp.]
MRSRFALWIIAGGLAAAALGAYVHVRSTASHAPVQPKPPAAAAPVTPTAAAPAAPGPIPFAPRTYPATPEAPTPEAAAPAAAARGAARPAAAPSRDGRVAAVLPQGTAAATVLQRLRADADRGDAAAACRIGVELMRCANPAPFVSATTRGPQVTTAAACSGISPQEAQQGWSYITRAAGGGSVVAQRVSLAHSAQGVSAEECGR